MTPPAIIITDFNGYAQTRRCLTALAASHDQDFRVIVVDHGTTGETAAGLREEFPAVTRLCESPDHWWTGATNAGIRFALGEGAATIILLNNDCYVMPDTLGELLELHRQHPDAIIAPVQRDWQTGAITCICHRTAFLLGFPTLAGTRRLTEAMQAERLLPARLLVGGRGAVIPAAAFRNAGLFDAAELPHYGADHDFYLCASKRGIPLRVATRALVDIDNTRTTLAEQPGRLSWAAFRQTLHSPRSHRNLAHLTALFRKHYPILGLYPLGVLLCLARYLGVYLISRGWFLLTAKGR